MRYLKSYKLFESVIKDKEEKKYFDLVFADYIDEGSTSKLVLKKRVD